ncbi:MAG: hypothetical protein ACPGUZ_03535 [Holosporaceae bacterium]
MFQRCLSLLSGGVVLCFVASFLFLGPVFCKEPPCEHAQDEALHLEHKINTTLYRVCPSACRRQKKEWSHQYTLEEGCKCLDERQQKDTLLGYIDSVCASACAHIEGYYWGGTYDTQLGCVCMTAKDATKKRYIKTPSGKASALPVLVEAPLSVESFDK